MRRVTWVAMALLWLASIGLAAAVGGFAARRAAPGQSPAADLSPPSAEGQAASSSSPSLEDLKKENASLQERLAQIEKERTDLGRDYLQLALKQSLESAPSTAAAPERIRGCWEAGIESMLAGKGGMLGKLEESIALLLDMAAFGEPGIRFLGGVANDPTRPNGEREIALQLLARLRHPAAFNIALDFRDDTIMELDYPYDLIRSHVAGLPTAEIAGRIPQILTQIDAELGADNFSPERPEVLFFLATMHNDARARQLLYDQRMWQENVQGAIAAANARHDQASYDFLNAVEQYHDEANTRARARSMLDRW